MSEIEINSELEGENNQKRNSSKETFLIHRKNWEDIKDSISKNIKEIFWEAWIKPLRFEEYDKGTLYLSSDSKIISNRAENQYYETIFFQASIFFKPLNKIQFRTVALKKEKESETPQDHGRFAGGRKRNPKTEIVKQVFKVGRRNVGERRNRRRKSPSLGIRKT